MSRTDAHRPAHVIMADHPELTEIHHDHRRGTCDLPESPAAAHLAPDAAWTWCDYRLSWQVRTCGCSMCTGGPARRTARRGERRAARQALHVAATLTAEEDLERTLARVRPAKRRY